MFDIAMRAGAAVLHTLAAPAAAPKIAEAAGGSFGDMLARVAQDGVSALKRSETLSLSALTGQAPTQEVVQAVMSAERSLQTAIAVRDKLVAAWQDVSRMSI